MKNFIAILIFIIALQTNCKANYVRTFLPKLVEEASVIAYGKIISIEDNFFNIVVLEKIKYQNLTVDTLRIQKFQNWTCASRYSKYEIGQEAVYFLKVNTEYKLQCMGSANEGELITKNNVVYTQDYEKCKFKSKKIPFLPPYIKYIETDIKTVLSGIKIYIENLELINKELNNTSNGKVVYQYSYIEKLPKNTFLNIILDQKQKGYY